MVQTSWWSVKNYRCIIGHSAQVEIWVGAGPAYDPVTGSVWLRAAGPHQIRMLDKFKIYCGFKRIKIFTKLHYYYYLYYLSCIWAKSIFLPSTSTNYVKYLKLDRMVDRVKPWFMVHGLAHGSWILVLFMVWFMVLFMVHGSWCP